MKKVCLFIMATVILFSMMGFTYVSAKEVSSSLTKAENEEFKKAFSQENIESALSKIDFNKTGKQTIKLSNNYVLNCIVTSTTNKISRRSMPAQSFMSVTPNYSTDYYTSTKSVYIDATALFGWKVWDLTVSGTFGYDYSSSWVIDSNYSANTHQVGWSYTDGYSRSLQVSSTEAKVIGGAKFYLGLKDVPVQSSRPVIAVGCNQNGSTIRYK